MNATHIPHQVIPDEMTDLLMPLQADGRRLLVAVPAADLARFPQSLLSQFCHQHAIYQLPTTELIDWLRQQIGGRTAIEIGSGNGATGRSLGIPLTDSYLQDGTNIHVANHYRLLNQPMITYPADVRKLAALSAVMVYRPRVIVGCWITHKADALIRPGQPVSGNYWGVEEHRFQGKAEQYIMVGNLGSHSEKPILRQFSHQVYAYDWLYSRSMKKDQNRIWVFNLR